MITTNIEPGSTFPLYKEIKKLCILHDLKYIGIDYRRRENKIIIPVSALLDSKDSANISSCYNKENNILEYPKITGEFYDIAKELKIPFEEEGNSGFKTRRRLILGNEDTRFKKEKTKIKVLSVGTEFEFYRDKLKYGYDLSYEILDIEEVLFEAEHVTADKLRKENRKRRTDTFHEQVEKYQKENGVSDYAIIETGGTTFTSPLITDDYVVVWSFVKHYIQDNRMKVEHISSTLIVKKQKRWGSIEIPVSKNLMGPTIGKGGENIKKLNKKINSRLVLREIDKATG